MAGFIFDMDGCLLDTIGAWHDAETRLTDSVGLVLTKQQRDELNTLTLEEAAAFFHERFGIMGSGEEVKRAIVAHLLEYYRTKAEATAGAVAFVESLANAGAPLCVLSSSPQSFLQAGLERSGMKGFFHDDLVISAEDHGWSKRNPTTFDSVCALLGTRLDETWLFDDSWYALSCAHGAGLRTVGTFSSDGCGTHEELARYCDLVVDDFTGLDPAAFLE